MNVSKKILHICWLAPTNRLSNENVNWVIVISHTKNKCFHTIVEVNNPILSDCGKIILHHNWKHNWRN
jgi:hypothetical protein